MHTRCKLVAFSAYAAAAAACSIISQLIFLLKISLKKRCTKTTHAKRKNRDTGYGRGRDRSRDRGTSRGSSSGSRDRIINSLKAAASAQRTRQ